jgi:hypothetical protein
MKSHRHERLALPKIGGWWMRAVAVLAKALHYGRAAQRDERKGFPYTVAMEWPMQPHSLNPDYFRLHGYCSSRHPPPK